MADCMMFPSEWEKFIEDYSFKDKEEVYTNGSVLIPVFRVEQMIEHYFGSKWIPVSERLPELMENVLLLLTCDDTAVGYRCEKFWRVVWMNSKLDNDEVTHWMPLPEPPAK